jgi:hypothetical protein
MQNGRYKSRLSPIFKVIDNDGQVLKLNNGEIVGVYNENWYLLPSCNPEEW